MGPRFSGKDVRRAVLRAAEQEVRSLGSRSVEAEHLLLALAAHEQDPAGRLLAESGLDHASLRAALERENERSLAAVGVSVSDFELPDPPPAPRRSPRFAASAKRALHAALRIAADRKDRRIGSLHVLLGVLDARIGTVPRALEAAEANPFALAASAHRLLDGDSATRAR